MKNRSATQKTRKMTTIAMLAALIIVLQYISTQISFGSVSITLALTPIIIGAALYGVGTGVMLGGAFGVITYIYGLMSLDKGFVLMMMSNNAIATTVICIGKGILAGAMAALIYRLFERRSSAIASLAAGIVTPITNTGIFALGLLTVMRGFLSDFAGANYSDNPVAFLFLAMIGVNFIVEFIVNVALSFAVTRIIAAFKKTHAQ